MKISALATSLLFAANAATTHAAETKQNIRKAQGDDMAEKLTEAIEVRLILRARSIILCILLHIVFHIIHIIYHIFTHINVIHLGLLIINIGKFRVWVMG